MDHRVSTSAYVTEHLLRKRSATLERPSFSIPTYSALTLVFLLKQSINEILQGRGGRRWRALPVREKMGDIAALSLARVMGAQVTWHLHEEVTHVLCDLQETGDIAVTPSSNVTTQSFRDPTRGQQL